MASSTIHAIGFGEAGLQSIASRRLLQRAANQIEAAALAEASDDSRPRLLDELAADILGLCPGCRARPGDHHDPAGDPEECEPGVLYYGQATQREFPAVEEIAEVLEGLAQRGTESAVAMLRRSAARPTSGTPCRCGAELLAGRVCASDPRPPRCGGCDHEMSHGTCPNCQPSEWLHVTGGFDSETAATMPAREPGHVRSTSEMFTEAEIRLSTVAASGRAHVKGGR